MYQLNCQALVNGPRLIFCLALLLALGLRFYKLGKVPPALSTDETIYGVAALKYQTSFLNININQGDPWGALWHAPEYTRPIHLAPPVMDRARRSGTNHMAYSDDYGPRLAAYEGFTHGR